jgi:hypothetical protein
MLSRIVTGGITTLPSAVSLCGSLRQPLIALRDAEHQRARLGVMHLLRVNARLLGAAAPMFCVVDQEASMIVKPAGAAARDGRSGSLQAAALRGRGAELVR